MSDKFTIYTDGSCYPNPGGPGGHAAVMEWKGARRRVSGGFAATTNNRMELLAAIAPLELLSMKPGGMEGLEVEVVSDSRYLVAPYTDGYIADWRRFNFSGRPNRDLWLRLEPLVGRWNPVFTWVRGHDGHPMNELCDKYALEERLKPDLPPDPGYIPKNRR
jgi:ribonuclease HI